MTRRFRRLPETIDNKADTSQIALRFKQTANRTVVNGRAGAGEWGAYLRPRGFIGAFYNRYSEIIHCQCCPAAQREWDVTPPPNFHRSRHFKPAHYKPTQLTGNLRFQEFAINNWRKTFFFLVNEIEDA